jgi:Icc-related predicted phosphoesterase
VKISILSDTHGAHWGLIEGSGDVLIHAGDFLRDGTLYDLKVFCEWLHDLDFKHKVVVAGNHDIVFQRAAESCAMGAAAQRVMEDYGITYLQDSGANVNGVKFWGSPWTPNFFPEQWVFNQPRNELAVERWKKIPQDVEVLITHGPPMGILDQCPDMNNRTKMVHVGCEALRDRVKELPHLKAHIFGHIHESRGVFQDGSGPLFFNASSLDGRYQPYANPVTEFEIPAPGES